MIPGGEEWFDRWIVNYPPPPGVELALQRARLSSNGEAASCE